MTRLTLIDLNNKFFEVDHLSSLIFSGPRAVAAIEKLSSHLGGARVVATSAVPDEIEAIQSALKKWVDEEGISLVITTGGYFPFL